LFGMNITFAVLGSVSGLLTLCLKDSLLGRLERSVGDKDGDGHFNDKAYTGNDKDRSGGREGDKVNVSFTANPMLMQGAGADSSDSADSADRAEALRLKEECVVAKEKNALLNGRVLVLRERLSELNSSLVEGGHAAAVEL
jgi:hypothetical protein